MTSRGVGYKRGRTGQGNWEVVVAEAIHLHAYMIVILSL